MNIYNYGNKLCQLAHYIQGLRIQFAALVDVLAKISQGAKYVTVEDQGNLVLVPEN